MIMRFLHRTATWTAILCAVTVTGFIVAFLFGVSPQSYVLIAVEAAATIGVVSLLVSALVVHYPTWRRSVANLALRGSPGDRVDETACLRRRREVLEERLQIDEPRLCSQYMIPCTCWSFCPGPEDKLSGWEGTSPAAQRLVRKWNVLSQAKDLEVVYRNGMDSCLFRFESPLRRSTSPDGATSSSTETGTAPRKRDIE